MLGPLFWIIEKFSPCKEMIVGNVDSGDGSLCPDRLDDVPLPSLTLYRREDIELGYRSTCGPGAGMYNMGNTCYLNSTLQALFYNPAFVNYLQY